MIRMLPLIIPLIQALLSSRYACLKAQPDNIDLIWSARPAPTREPSPPNPPYLEQFRAIERAKTRAAVSPITTHLASTRRFVRIARSACLTSSPVSFCIGSIASHKESPSSVQHSADVAHAGGPSGVARRVWKQR